MESIIASVLVAAITLLHGCSGDPVATKEVVTLRYERSDNTSAPMDIQIDRASYTITYHMRDNQGFFGDVNTLEDYATGYALSRVASQESCFLRQLPETLDEAIQRIHGLDEDGVQHIITDLNVWAEPVSDLQGMAGSRIADFCGEQFSAYKLVKPDQQPVGNRLNSGMGSSSNTLAEYLKETDPRDVADNQDKRLFLLFYGLLLFNFLPITITTTITITTGFTLVFFPCLFG
ncbi:uncharacterized protein [Palaemon carinicauda]|uniref:uncharacterized protein n=1 Tax=Palaemon carinicauda TaxID=392227 RepID=UPI0035B5E781